MASADDVIKLAALARIAVDDASLEKFAKEFDTILAYVGQLESLVIPHGVKNMKPAVRNVLREDTAPHASGEYTEKLVKQFPAHEGNRLKVKQIIQND
jgi:aspartyl/glutamyl-tRNA(Asn/Gln) amidotransferase C subunit